MAESFYFFWISLKGAAKYILEVFVTEFILVAFAEFIGIIQPIILQGRWLLIGCIVVCMFLFALGIGLFRCHIDFIIRQKEESNNEDEDESEEDSFFVGFEILLADLFISFISIIELWSIYN